MSVQRVEKKPVVDEYWDDLSEEKRQAAFTHADYLMRYGYSLSTEREALAKHIAWAKRHEPEGERKGLVYE